MDDNCWPLEMEGSAADSDTDAVHLVNFDFVDRVIQREVELSSCNFLQQGALQETSFAGGQISRCFFPSILDSGVLSKYTFSVHDRGLIHSCSSDQPSEHAWNDRRMPKHKRVAAERNTAAVMHACNAQDLKTPLEVEGLSYSVLTRSRKARLEGLGESQHDQAKQDIRQHADFKGSTVRSVSQSQNNYRFSQSNSFIRCSASFRSCSSELVSPSPEAILSGNQNVLNHGNQPFEQESSTIDNTEAFRCLQMEIDGRGLTSRQSSVLTRLQTSRSVASEKQETIIKHQSSCKKKVMRKDTTIRFIDKGKQLTLVRHCNSKDGMKIHDCSCLDGSGLSWIKGKRRSTRIRSRPLEYWRGERFLLARICRCLPTVIGIKHIADSRTRKKSSDLKVVPYVQGKYSALVQFQGRY